MHDSQAVASLGFRGWGGKHTVYGERGSVSL